MPGPKRFPFSSQPGVALPSDVGLPYLGIGLSLGTESPMVVEGLLDTGASVNVLPYSIGMRLGAHWSDQAPKIRLTGNLSNVEAQGLILNAHVADFPLVRLAFETV